MVQIVLLLLMIVGTPTFSQIPIGEEESKPLLRVYPIFRPEECEWSPRFDICLRCMKRKERYAQKIYFYKEGGPYREHGCFTDERGFYPLH